MKKIMILVFIFGTATLWAPKKDEKKMIDKNNDVNAKKIASSIPISPMKRHSVPRGILHDNVKKKVLPNNPVSLGAPTISKHVAYLKRGKQILEECNKELKESVDENEKVIAQEKVEKAQTALKNAEHAILVYGKQFDISKDWLKKN